LEEARTNLIGDSSFQNFGSSIVNNQWFEVSSSSDVTSNQVVSPDGGTNAASYYINTSTGFQATLYRTGVATGTNYVFSVFAKAGAISDNVTLFLGGDITTNYIRAVFTLTGNGSYSGSFSSGTAVVASNPTIQAMGNGWYRCTIYASFTSPTNVTSLIYPGLYSSQAEGTTTYLWGAQLEAASTASSYIPTTGSTVTRAADISTSVATSVFESSWYRRDEGTVFASYQFPAGTAVNTGNRHLLDMTSGTTADRFSVRGIVSATIADQITVRSGGSTVAQFNTNGTAVGTALRTIAAVYRLNDYAAVATGSASAVTDTSGALPVGTNQASIGSAVNGVEYLSGHIRRLTYWPTRLGNEVLQRITQ
jgi:hypothetical protein